jgi:DNA-directed RNA polymerase II subunit RPB1
MLRLFEASMLDEMPLQGISAIPKVFMNQPESDDKKRAVIGEDGSYRLETEWVLETTGSSFLEVGFVVIVVADPFDELD